MKKRSKERMQSGMAMHKVMEAYRQDMIELGQIEQGQKRIEDFTNELELSFRAREMQEDIQRGREAADAVVKQRREAVEVMKKEMVAHRE